MSVSVPVIDFIDPVNRRIWLQSGIDAYHPVTDIYHEVRYLRRTDESLRPYPVFVTAAGNDPKNLAGTRRTPRYAIFQDCKIVLSGDTRITGEQLFANNLGQLVGSGPDCIDKSLSPQDAYSDYTPPDAEVIIIETLEAQEIKDDIAQIQADITTITGQIISINSNIGTINANIGTINSNIATIQSDISGINVSLSLTQADVSDLLEYMMGEWHIESNPGHPDFGILTSYKTNGDVLRKFYLQDAEGNLVATNPLRRIPISGSPS